VQRLAHEFGTPFFVISERQLRAEYRALMNGLVAVEMLGIVRSCAKTNNEARVLGVIEDTGVQLRRRGDGGRR